MNPVVYLRSETSLRGVEVYARGSSSPISAFLGIPFAEPPVGKLRFAIPVPINLWTGKRDATRYGPICPQNLESTQQTYFPFPIPNNVSEDCLYLNVWTPKTNPDTLLPVMVWFYGGAYIQGLSNYFDGTVYATVHDVVFVSFNYRVGPFGFMCTEDGYVKGNMGLFDQLEALKWIQRHIRSFGGNPDNVTVFGESAGAISIALHLLSPLSTGLFKRAILQSGASFYPSACWSVESASKYIFSHANKWSGVKLKSGKELVEFLEGKSEAHIVKHLGLGFNPVVDGFFMPNSPVYLYGSGKFNPIEILIGFNSDEGFSFIDRLIVKNSRMTPKAAADMLQNIVFKQFFRGLPNADKIYEAFYKQYLENIEDAHLLHNKIVEIYGHVLFILPCFSQAEQHSKQAKVFLYQFHHRPMFSRLPNWVVADHGQEIPYVIGEPFLERLPNVWNEEERKISSMMMTYWANFARTGDPNCPSLPTWPAYTIDKKQHLVICHSPTIKADMLHEKVCLWKDTILPLTAGKSKI